MVDEDEEEEEEEVVSVDVLVDPEPVGVPQLNSCKSAMKASENDPSELYAYLYHRLIRNSVRMYFEMSVQMPSPDSGSSALNSAGKTGVISGIAY